MNDLDVLAVAYQRKDGGDARPISIIVAEIRSHLEEISPPVPGPTDQIGFKSEKIGGVRKNYKVMGDGSMVEIEQ